MVTVYAIHEPDPTHLADVMAAMRTWGAPNIDVVACGDHYRALDGSHRLAAAHALGVVPKLRVIQQDTRIDVRWYDWYDSANWPNTEVLAGEVIGELHDDVSPVPYRFEDVDEEDYRCAASTP